MKTIMCLCLGLFFLSSMPAAEINDHTYLKIELGENNEISYPPGTGFVAQDSEGNTVLSPADLEALGSYEVTEPITLFVFTIWNEEPDVYELTSGKLLLGKTDRSYTNDSYQYKKRRTEVGKKVNSTDHFSRPTDSNEYNGHRGVSNGVRITATRFFDFDEKTGYDTSIEFSNDVTFYYRDGKASAWQNGNDLKIDGKYLIETKNGIIKLSYNPSNKKIWWVFDKKK